MITDFFANHPSIPAALLVIWQLIEMWLGFRKPVDAGSVPQLLWNLILRVKSRFTKGESPMASSNPNVRTIQVVVDGPTYDALGVVVSLVKDIASGKKPQDAVTAALPQILSSFSQLGQIPEDARLDKASVVEAVSQRVGDLAEAFALAQIAYNPVVTPK